MDTEQSVINVPAIGVPIPLPGPRKRLAPENRREELVAAALKLFVARGFAATKLDDVAREAGVSKGLPYRYFKSKEELFKAVVRQAVLGPLSQVEAALPDYRGSIADLLRILVEHQMQFAGETAGGISKLISAEATNFPEIARFYMEEVAVRGRKFLADLIRRGIASGEFREVDADAMARVIGAPLKMMEIYRHSLGPFDPEPIQERFVQAYLDLVLVGLNR